MQKSGNVLERGVVHYSWCVCRSGSDTVVWLQCVPCHCIPSKLKKNFPRGRPKKRAALDTKYEGKMLYYTEETLLVSTYSKWSLDFWLCALHTFCQTCRHALTPVNLSTQSVCCCGELRLYLVFAWIMRWHRKSERAKEGRRRTVGRGGWYGMPRDVYSQWGAAPAG